MDSGWLTLLYQYGIGGLVFGGGIALILKTKACDLSIPQERKWFFWLLGGFGWMFTLHFLWTCASYYL